MTDNEDLSPLAALRGECLHLAVRMLSYSDAERIDPRDAIRLAEEYVVWILEAGLGTSADNRGCGQPRHTLLPADTRERSEPRSRH